jgi:hypothetical protein
MKLMIRTLIILAIITAVSLFGHDEGKFGKSSATEGGISEECPTISVGCPYEDKEISFTVRVTGEDPKVKLGYQWTITRGELKSGQGTAKIIVQAERDGSGIGASVEVTGLPAECAKKASCYITHF